MAGQLDEAAKQILGTLLANFTDLKLTAKDLKETYEGPKVEALATAVCNVDDITQVDFEVAFSDLEKAKLIGTGPRVPFENTPGKMMIIGSYSKREYAYLTETGYKEARKAPNRPQRVQRVVNHVHISGGQFSNSNLQLSAGEHIQQSMNVQNGTDPDVVSQLIAILESRGQQISSEQRKDLETAVSEASQGNAGNAKSFLAKVCGPMWESLQPVMWPIVGEIVKKSIGF
ncbi:hypothetical protein [Yersinia proxima]|uniref:hypothetical protein n=1 Tax=Yersinia proxima TaxID=2890316 RepID=UPI001D1183F9|nr:hypothetical protein [Yersinia proxima]